MNLVLGHSLENGAALHVAGRQSLEVILEMRLDLPLRLGDETEAHGIAERAGREADAEAARIPERPEQARSRSELVEPRAAPGEGIAVVARRVGKRRVYRTGCGRLGPAPSSLSRGRHQSR